MNIKKADRCSYLDKQRDMLRARILTNICVKGKKEILYVCYYVGAVYQHIHQRERENCTQVSFTLYQKALLCLIINSTWQQ